MTTLAERLDPCVNWFKLVARTRGRILWLFPAAFFFIYLVAVAKNGDIFEGFSALRSQHAANAPLLDEARRLNLDYDTVAANPSAYAGKPVAWCVDRPAPDVAYVSGRPSWPVMVDVPFADYRTSSASGGYCYDVLAVVRDSGRGVVKLHVVGKL